MEISTEEIQSLGSPEIFQRGWRYYKQGRVTLTSAKLDRFEATVRGTYLYTVHVRRADGVVETACDCPYEKGVCKHVIAALHAAQGYYRAHAERLRTYQDSPWRQFLDSILARPTAPKPDEMADEDYQWQLFYSLRALDRAETRWIILPCRVQLHRDGRFGRIHHSIVTTGTLLQEKIKADSRDRLILARLNTLALYYDRDPRSAMLGETLSTVAERERRQTLTDLLPLMKDRLLYRAIGSQPMGQRLTVAEAPWQIAFRLQKQSDGTLELFPVVMGEGLEPRVDGQFRLVSARPLWLMKEHQLLPIQSELDAELLQDFIREGQPLKISPADADQFFEDYFLTLHGRCSLQTDLVTWKELEVPAVDVRRRIYLREEEGQLWIELRFGYDRWEVTAGDTRRVFKEPGKPLYGRVTRYQELEERSREMLCETGLRPRAEGDAGFRLTTDPWHWLLHAVPLLTAEGFEVYGEESLRHHRVNRHAPEIELEVRSEIDWFDLKLAVRFGEQSLSLAALRDALQKGTRYVRLDDGSMGLLPTEWFEKYRHLFEFAESTDTGLRFSKYHLTLIDELYQEATQKQGDERFLRSWEKLKRFAAIQPQELPGNFRGELRPYQKASYDWLYFLQEFGFGGCLADDMGLGKTICTLALLARENERGSPRPSLLVVPTSLVFNWLAEAGRFTPDLQILAQTGADRPKTAEGFRDYDLILTTYGTLRKDITWLKDYPFHYAILDESQQIKNPASQIAKAVKLLRATHRLALSGTPVENNTLELWSQFAFLNPGLLGNLTQFKERFARTIEREKDAEAAALLKRLIYPFILRRTKQQVAQELPPKVENVVYCEMEAPQRRLYQQWRDYYRAAVLGLIDEQGLNRSRMKILEGLTKLRQICCHPSLIEADCPDSSGKLELFKEMLTSILAEGHKVLVFSQFVKMLEVVCRHLEAEKIIYEYLDGKTPPRQRKARVERFQTDGRVPVFLISLRAGGLGLNLTAADYVIQLDPWWNPAVEVQATDRTHRIGQTRHVFAYKLITKGTVEEKILELQERKRRLVQELITTESSFFKNLTREDVRVLFS